MSKIDKNCVECGKLPTKKDSAREIYLCVDCHDLPKYKLICKTDVKNTYFMTEKELIDITSYSVYHYRNKCDMTLYPLQEVVNLFANKHDISSDPRDITVKLEELKQDRQNKKQKRHNKKQTESLKRKQLLIEALAKFKLELRADSKLCSGYIDGTIKDCTIDGIVRRMCEMKYLFDYCDMDTYIEEAYESQREERKQGFYPDCTVFEEAEMYALRKYGEYPTIFPWLL